MVSDQLGTRRMTRVVLVSTTHSLPPRSPPSPNPLQPPIPRSLSLLSNSPVPLPQGSPPPEDLKKWTPESGLQADRRPLGDRKCLRFAPLHRKPCGEATRRRKSFPV
ncbi:hypothetical protein BHE74_00057718 [Ensete ventricosum]|nr:hypothetical protein BHE74_00057718 [Ensete ventricosum]